MTDPNSIRTQFDLIAKQYDEGRRCFIPCFDDYYTRSVSLLKNLKPQASKIVDLGVGTGLLTQELYKLYPKAKFTLIDVSEEMLEVAKQRFKGLENFTFMVADYSNIDLVKGDIICSALSIHHLEDKEKQRLYKTVYKALSEGGVFVNLDQFCAVSPLIDNAWNAWWMNYIDNSFITSEAKAKWLERKKLDREVSIPHTLAMLMQAGFKHVDCIYQFMKFGTIIAYKEPNVMNYDYNEDNR